MSENESLVRELEVAREKIADMTRELEASQAIIEVRLRYIVLFENLIVTKLLSFWVQVSCLRAQDPRMKNVHIAALTLGSGENFRAQSLVFRWTK